MSVRIKIARTAEEMDKVFIARHEVFVEEEGYFQPNKSGRIFDEYDAFPSTVNIIATVDQEVVGGLRITELSKAGTPPEHLFDFRPYIPSDAHKVAAASMLCVKRQYRMVRSLTFMLLSMGIYWLISKKVSHVIAAINPVVETIMKGIGFNQIHPPFIKEELGIQVLPMLLDLRDLSPKYTQMAQFQGFYGTLRTFEREFFRAGEKIIQSGDEGDCAYVIIDGRVTVSVKGRRSDDRSKIIINELDKGEIFGELSLLTQETRSADVYAATDVDLMVIDKDIFQEQLLGNPDLQFKLLELLGRRLRGLCMSDSEQAIDRQGVPATM